MPQIEAQETNKVERIDVRIKPEQKTLIKQAAALAGLTLTDFVVSHLQEAAIQTLKEHETMTLRGADREVFISALLNPPEPGPRLRKAAKRYMELMEG